MKKKFIILVSLCALSIIAFVEDGQERQKTTQAKDQIIVNPAGNSLSQNLKLENTKPTSKSLLVSGPLLGFAGHHEVKIWLQTQRPAKVQIRYWPQSNKEASLLSPIFHTNGQEVYTVQAVLSPLKSGTRYAYQIIINDQISSFPYEFPLCSP